MYHNTFVEVSDKAVYYTISVTSIYLYIYCLFKNSFSRSAFITLNCGIISEK